VPKNLWETEPIILPQPEPVAVEYPSFNSNIFNKFSNIMNSF
jgi:hypothetical protein